MSRLLRAVWSGHPQETRFFLIIAAWAAALGLIYWVGTAEAAGTLLLAGLALASGAMTAWLVAGRPRRRPPSPAEDGSSKPPETDEPRPGAPDTSGGGTAGVDRPFLDEEGRIPDATVAPFAVGLGLALMALGPVFGLAPVTLGVVALAWGAASWFGAARDELGALDGADRSTPSRVERDADR
jgi:hypothetical protein